MCSTLFAGLLAIRPFTISVTIASSFGDDAVLEFDFSLIPFDKTVLAVESSLLDYLKKYNTNIDLNTVVVSANRT